jgi:cell division protein ZapA
MEEQGKSRVTITIMGEEYILRGTSSPEKMHQVGRYVDQLMRTLAENNIQMNRHKIAVLAALNLADELFKAKPEKALEAVGADERDSDDELV